MIGNQQMDPRGISPTKQSIKNYLMMYSGCNEMEVAESFDTIRTRHICLGSKEIIILDKTFVPVPTNRGIINVEVFFCPRCRKLIINNESMEVML